MPSPVGPGRQPSESRRSPALASGASSGGPRSEKRYHRARAALASALGLSPAPAQSPPRRASRPRRPGPARPTPTHPPPRLKDPGGHSYSAGGGPRGVGVSAAAPPQASEGRTPQAPALGRGGERRRGSTAGPPAGVVHSSAAAAATPGDPRAGPLPALPPASPRQSDTRPPGRRHTPRRTLRGTGCPHPPSGTDRPSGAEVPSGVDRKLFRGVSFAKWTPPSLSSARRS